MMKLLGLLCLLLASHQAVCGQKNSLQLQTKMDYFLVSVLEVRQSLGELRDDVTSLQQQQNASANLDQAMTGAESPQSGSGSMVCPSSNLEPQLAVLVEGFKEEKAVLRREVQQQNKDITTIATTVTDTKTKLDETLKEHEQAIARTMDDMKEELQVKHDDSMSKAMKNIKRTMNGKYSDAATQHDALSVKVNDVESKVKQVQDTLSDLEHSLLTLTRSLATIELQRGFTLYGSSWYKIIKKRMNWSDAHAHCQEEGMYLIELNDHDELTQVQKWLGAMAWIGASDSEEEGTWKWATSGETILSSLWAPRQPDNWQDENCMSTYKSGTVVNDAQCYYLLPFVCEL